MATAVASESQAKRVKGVGSLRVSRVVTVSPDCAIIRHSALRASTPGRRDGVHSRPRRRTAAWPTPERTTMRRTLAITLTFAPVLALGLSAAAPTTAAANGREKPRLIVLTDVSNEPDDEESLVRLLVYSNEFDLEGLIATTSVWLREKTAPRPAGARRRGLRAVAGQPPRAYARLPDARVAAGGHQDRPAGLRPGGRRSGQVDRGFTAPDRGRRPTRSAAGVDRRLGRGQHAGAGAVGRQVHAYARGAGAVSWAGCGSTPSRIRTTPAAGCGSRSPSSTTSSARPT